MSRYHCLRRPVTLYTVIDVCVYGGGREREREGEGGERERVCVRVCVCVCVCVCVDGAIVECPCSLPPSLLYTLRSGLMIRLGAL